MAENIKKPLIRFKGFTDTWEQRKVYGLVNRFDNLRIPITAALRISGNTPYYGANGIQDYVSGYTHKGEFILIAEDGANDLKNYPVQYVNGEIWVNNHAHVLQNKENVSDNKFLKYSISNTNIESVLVGGGRAKLTANALMNIELSIPTQAEQCKLGNLFHKIDNLITLHQRKYEKFVNVKKAMLEKMFPQGSDKTPKIRFKGFTDTWEQRKLSDVADYRNGKAHEQDISENGNFVVINSKFVSTSGEVYKYSLKQNEPLFENEIAFVLSDVPNGKALAKTFLVPKSGKYTLNQRIAGITPHSDIAPYYLYTIMNRNKYFLSFDDGAKQTNLSIDDVKKFEEFYPLLKEQNKISYLLMNLDNLITLHQRKAKILENIKISLLIKGFNIKKE